MNKLQALLLILLATIIAGAQEVQFHGFLDSYHAVRLNDPYDFLSSRNRVRLETTVYTEEATGFVSFDIEHNNVLEDYDELNLREAYIDYFGEDWDIRIGKQIIIWGKTEGLQILDAVSPWDFTEFLARDFEDLRIGVDALRFRYLQDSWTLELIYIPKFEPAIAAPSDSPWAYDPMAELGDQIPVTKADEPEFTFENGEFGARLLFYEDWGDLSLVVLRTWSDEASPFIPQPQSLDIPSIELEYQRLNIYGFGLSIPKSEFVFRAEVALYQGTEILNILNPLAEAAEYDQFKWVAGLDWSPGNGWSISTQLTDSQVLDYQPGLFLPEHNRMMTLSISKTIFREKLNLSTFSFVGLEHGDTFSRLSGDYSLSDAVHLLAGVDIFTGDEGYLATFAENDEAWFKFKYSF